MIPADPLALILKNRAQASPDIVETYRLRYGLDRSLPEQFFLYLSGLARGDLGTSFATRQPVSVDLARICPRLSSWRWRRWVLPLPSACHLASWPDSAR